MDAYDTTRSTRIVRTSIAYVVVIAAAVALFFWIRSLGIGLSAPLTHKILSLRTGSYGFDAMLLHVLLALATVIAAARALGTLFRYLAQPAVIGEVIGGILLGPSFLGQFWPEVSSYVLPHTIVPLLNVVAQLGVILFMFLIGVEFSPARLRRSSTTVLAISHSSIICPFLLGCAASLFLYPRYASGNVPFGVFILFMGIALSITAFPVLARILTDRGFQRSRLGAIALTCAAVDDVTAWCLLALVIATAKADFGGALRTLFGALIFALFMLTVMRPLLAWLARQEEGRPQPRQSSLAIVLVALMLCGFATERIGIHALFGAFILGALIPCDSSLARYLIGTLRDFAVVFFLPVYFAFTGLRTQVNLLEGTHQWVVCGAIILLASAGKFGGGFIAARLTGLRWRECAALGVLMNTRGLMELIVINIGLDMGVLSPLLFAMLVLMAVVTTLATTPLLDALNFDRKLFDH